MESLPTAFIPAIAPQVIPVDIDPTRPKQKARDILAALRTLKTIEREKRPASDEERQALARFNGFGAVANVLFPNEALLRKEPDHPFRGYRTAGLRVLGEELKALLSPEEYASVKGTTFSQFFTSRIVMAAMHRALTRLGVSEAATVLEPGCGTGNFMELAPRGQRFIGVEKDVISGRIARALHPKADIRIENFADTKLQAIDAVIGNVPFGDVDFSYKGGKLALHDFFTVKSLDALKPGGVMAIVTTHFTLDKQNGAVRELIAGQADFLGAIRLPSDAFEREGTSVVTDILLLRKRANGQTVQHVDDAWLATAPLSIEGEQVAINQYFLRHPEMVLGQWSRQNRLYRDTYSLIGNGDLGRQLAEAIERLPELPTTPPVAAAPAAPVPFVPPPPLPHITEGSFFVSKDRSICQVEGGEGRPVVYGGTALKANGTKTGKRLAGLLGLRDLARQVLRSQNEGWPETHRAAARRDLNRAYDLFVATYGPINTTTFSESDDGTVTRRMPNIVKFREDPDAMLVMALEEYDDVSGTARKAPILLRDVVGPKPPVTHVGSAEEGLLVCLDQKGAVDLRTIAELYGKSKVQVIDELGDLIWHDPHSKTWQTADEYLSGNVREKLRIAESAGREYAANAEALRAVQPEDVLPGDIDANLGAPWIPEADIQAFATELFGVGSNAIQIAHLKKDAEWSVEADGSAVQSVAATSDYGTPRANGTKLLELALNLKPPVVYDPDPDDPDRRIVNQEQTLAAREKQKLIKEKFRAWVFADPERCERLVRLYNDTYNNLRPRLFDGSHLDFPGMNQAVQLHRHQKDAIWRGMSSGNTLLAHAVGAGKTFTMAATGMKRKQAGLTKKPMYVVPNHMLEQFAREFMQLYPNARLLVATKDDLARDRRKLLVAKIASGEWDGIIITHSSFERIGMSAAYQERFLKEQIAEYEELLLDSGSRDASRAKRNLIKAIEKQKARREERLKDLLAEDKKDDGLVFDELGVDHVFIDESHYFKNLETPTKMDRVAGIQAGGSERAFDLFMKARFLSDKHPGHGVTFATGTPVSNTMVELYTIQRFLDPEGMRSGGIDHFDGWAGLFGEVIDTMEIAPDGATLKPRSRFARFTNLAELMQMVRKFSDVQTADMLNLPRPRLKTGKPIVVACPMSDEQRDLQATLVARYDQLRTQKVDPREDNALAITTDGNKLALDARMLSPTAKDFPTSKLNALVGNVARTWKETEGSRGTQLIFSDTGVNPTPWGFCVYDEIIDKLVASGIPRNQIAAIGDADTDAKKQSLFERVRNGTVRVLIGSTQKMGTGTNVQKRLVAEHDLDAPWKPAEVEQRNGRILRQGNDNAEVAIYRYVTEGSFDAYRWQALETKARFIAQVMTGESAVRRAEDIGGEALSYAEVKAIASGNPAVLTLADADAELHRLGVLRRNHDDDQFLARKAKRELPETIDHRSKRVRALEAELATLAAHAGDPIRVGASSCSRDHAMALLADRLDRMPERVRDTAQVPLGRFRGLAFGLTRYPSGAAEVFLDGVCLRHGLLSRDSQGPRAILGALDRLAASYDGQLVMARQELALAEKQLTDYAARLGKPFLHDAYQSELTGLRDKLKLSLSGGAPEAGAEPLPPAAELAEQIKALKSAHSIDTAPVRPRHRTQSAAESVTTRIRRNAARVVPEGDSDEAWPEATTAESDTVAPPASPNILPLPVAKDSRPAHARPSHAGHAHAGFPSVLPLHGKAAEIALQPHAYALIPSGNAAQDREANASTHSNGRVIMARSRKAGDESARATNIAEGSNEVSDLASATSAQPEQAATTTTEAGAGHGQASDGRPPIETPEPRSQASASMAAGRGAPRVRLLRSHRFKQMQIRFDETPDEKYLMMLKEAGWRDRTEEEGIWTKQIPNGSWQTVLDAERLFERIANGIRADKGLEPVLDGISAA